MPTLNCDRDFVFERPIVGCYRSSQSKAITGVRVHKGHDEEQQYRD
jgi:hypothetical protein